MTKDKLVTKYLFDLIAKQVEDHLLVIWYDPEQVYSTVAEDLELPKTTVVRYDGSFFQLRHDIDSLLNDEQPPRLVVYVPEDRGDTHNALIELEAAGVVIQPGQQPPNRNTRLAIIARNALKPVLGEETACGIEKQVESGKLLLADLNTLADKGKDISTGVLSLIFGTANPQEVALAFLHNDDHDKEIDQKSARKDLVGLLQRAFEVELYENGPLPGSREQLARHVLLTDLITALGDAVPPSLASVTVASEPSAIDACVGLARTWRLRRDVRENYVVASQQVEQEFSLSHLEFNPEKLLEIETFFAIEKALIRHVEQSLLESATDKLLALAQSRLSRFWSDVTPSIQAHWALIAAASEVLLGADRVAKALKKAPSKILLLIRAYAEGDTPWCLLDTYHRRLESRWYTFEPELGADHRSLEQLIMKAEQCYTDIGTELAKHFVTQFHKTKHPIKDVLRQRDVFEKQVKPRLNDGKIAYVWVDALRFEMARELCDVLKEDFDLTIQPALSTIPTITEIGMASLLPHAGESAKVVAVGGGELALEIEGTVIKDRKNRITYLKNHAGVSVFDTKLDSLLPKPSKKVRDGIQNAQLILVTSQEIDELGEQDNIPFFMAGYHHRN